MARSTRLSVVAFCLPLDCRSVSPRGGRALWRPAAARHGARYRSAATATAQYVGAAAARLPQALDPRAWQGCSMHRRCSRPRTRPYSSLRHHRFSRERHYLDLLPPEQRYFVPPTAGRQVSGFRAEVPPSAFTPCNNIWSFADGRMQALSIAWDARPAHRAASAGTTVMPGRKSITPIPLHWTRAGQN